MGLSDNLEDFVRQDVDTSAADRNLIVRFSNEKKLDATATAEKGENVYRDREYVTILIPGDKRLTVHRPVMPADKVRFAMQYNAWKGTNGNDSLFGTPLAGWPSVTDGQRAELAHFNIFTVEQLAALNDGYASNMMGVQQLKQAAQRYVATVKESAPLAKMAKDLEVRDEQIAAMKIQLEELSAVVREQAKAKRAA